MKASLLRPLVLLLVLGSLVARGAPTRAVAGPAEIAPSPVTVQWQKRVMGRNIGLVGLHVADLNGDGQKEIVATAASNYGGTHYWYTMKWDGARYVHDWIGPWYPQGGLVGLEVANVDQDANPEVIEATDVRITIYDGATRAVQHTFPIVSVGADEIQVVDVDSDGEFEVLLCGFFGFRIYSLSGALEYSNPAHSGTGVAIGNVDADPGLEIVIGALDGDPGFVLDGTTRAVEWTLPSGFGKIVRLGDFDGDGMAELVAAPNYGAVRVYDVDTRTLVATFPSSARNVALEVMDVEGDGTLEIVHGDDGARAVVIRDGATRAVKWSKSVISFGYSDFKGLAVGDSDNDGARELLFGGNGDPVGSQLLFVVGVASQAVEWSSEDVLGGFGGLAYGDADADGRRDFISASVESNGAHSGGIVFVDDAVSGVNKSHFGQAYDIFQVRTASADADPQDEIFVASSGTLAAYDGLTRTEQWRAGLNAGAIAVADVDLDGQLEVVASATGGVAVVLDARTGVEEWRTPVLSVSPYASRLRVANVDSDPAPEIVLAQWYGAVFVIDGVTRAAQPLPNFGVSALDTADTNGDGIHEILVGNDEGLIRSVSGVNGAVLGTIGDWGEDVNALEARDLDGDGQLEMTVAIDEELLVSRLDGCVVWRSGAIGAGVGSVDSLLVDDIDGDGRIEIAANIGVIGFNVYEVNLPPNAPCVDYLPGFRVGDAAIVEGNSGSKNLAFTVSLHHPIGGSVSVSAQTTDLTATAGSDYTAVGPVTFTFLPGETSKTLLVPVSGDTVFEGDETVQVTLSAAVGASIADAIGIGTIVNDEPPLRTFVSHSGSDASNCSIQNTPCRSIGAALAQTAEDGEIIILASGSYEAGPLTISKGIKITSPSGTVAFIRQPITINAAGGRIVLRGLSLKGSGTGDAMTLTAADSLSVEDTTIDRWATGLKLANTVATQVTILNSVFRANATGIGEGAGGPVNVVAIEDSRFERNTTGVQAQASSLNVRESLFTGNTTTGLIVGPGLAEVRQSVFSLNGTAIGTLAGGTARVSRSHVFGNTVGFSASPGSTFESFGNNVVRGNGTDTTGTITTIPEQ